MRFSCKRALRKSDAKDISGFFVSCINTMYEKNKVKAGVTDW